MFRTVRRFIEKHDAFYVLWRSIRGMHDPLFAKIIRGFYNPLCIEECTLLIEHYGEHMPDVIIYDIPRGEEQVTHIGLFADIHQLLYRLKFAELINAVPRVRWGDKMPYYDHGMDGITKNAFEYYFEPISEASNYSLYDFKNVIRTRENHVNAYQNMHDDSYKIEETNISTLAEIYKKYIHLNKKTKIYICGEIDKLFGRNNHIPLPRILGVHARGTDFNLGLLNHPNVIAPNEYLEKAKEIFSKGEYDKIFLATEDSDILEQFTSEFGNNVIYYEDVFRTSGSSGPHSTHNERKFNNYLLGLEVLRDVYTLAYCDGFISGLSHVAFAARYVNCALSRKYDELIILNNGINRQT